MIYFFIVDFFFIFVCDISNKLFFYVLQYGRQIYDSNLRQTILATSSSFGNIHCSYQHYQSGPITLHFSVLASKYLVSTSYELWMM